MLPYTVVQQIWDGELEEAAILLLLRLEGTTEEFRASCFARIEELRQERLALALALEEDPLGFSIWAVAEGVPPQVNGALKYWQ